MLIFESPCMYALPAMAGSQKYELRSMPKNVDRQFNKSTKGTNNIAAMLCERIIKATPSAVRILRREAFAQRTKASPAIAITSPIDPRTKRLTNQYGVQPKRIVAQKLRDH